MTIRKRYIQGCFFGVLVAVTGPSCANQIPPAGGPVDTDGPRVVYVYPEPYSLHAETNVIEIEFDEYVDKRSAMEAVFISPRIENLEFDWWGTTLELSFESPLQPNTTYVVSIGTDVTDLEPSRKNRMDRAFTFPFSTGATIDRGLITGRVLPLGFDDQMRGVMVYAYEIPPGHPDTLNVLHASPTYITQASKDGTFAFPHIRIGRYFVFSVRDASRNIVYDREEDEYAVPVAPVVLSDTDTAATGLVLQLAREDTTAPRMTGVTPVDMNHLLADISEPIDTAGDRRPVALLFDTTTGAQKSIYAITPVLTRMNQVELTTEAMDPEAVYGLELTRIFDIAGNQSAAGTSRLVFSPGAKPDTLPPALQSRSVRDSSKDVSVGEEVLFSFSEPLSHEAWSEERVSLRPVPDGTPERVTTRWVTESVLGIRAVGELRSSTWYQLTVILQGLRDWKLRSLRDSVSVLNFRTEDVYESGTIEGFVRASASTDSTGRLIVVARSIEGKDGTSHMVEASQDGVFSVARLKPGRYALYGFEDRNGNRSFDPGSPFPYTPPERRSLWTDTLKVRSRWPLEGVRINIP